MTADLDFYALAKGDAFPPFPVAIDDADVRAYLDATGEEPDRWAGAVPPLAAGAFALAALMARLPLPGGALHAGQEFEFLRAIAPGEPLEAELRVGQRTERRGTLLLAFDLELRPPGGGEAVLRGRSTVVAQVADAEPAE